MTDPGAKAKAKNGSTGNWIPNIIIRQDYDQRYQDATIHYDALSNLAEFFGRDMPVHRHSQYLQIHFIETALCKAGLCATPVTS